MSSIWKPKSDYNTVKDFKERTQRSLSGKDHATLSADADPERLTQHVVDKIKEQLGSIKAELNRDLNILEIGSGYGRWPVVLDGLYGSYTGVDVTESRVNHANKHYSNNKVEFSHIEPCNWNLEKEYDVVLFLMCLQHLKMQDALDTLAIAEKHLTGDGVMVLWEGRIGRITEEEANYLYSKDDCPAHMIYKPISLFEQAVPLSWNTNGNSKFPCNFILRRKNETTN